MTREIAIKNVKEFLNGTCLRMQYQEAFETLIPELRENEDERIRQVLINIVKGACDKYGIKYIGDEIGQEKLLAYLEKQKEQKPVDSEEHFESVDNAFRRGREVGFCEGVESVKQHAEWSEEDWKLLDEMRAHLISVTRKIDLSPNNVYEAFIDLIDRLKSLHFQKLVGRSYQYGINETVDKLVSIAECLEMDGDCLFNGYTGTECGKFLRDLARKQVECKSVEWSEEDERMLKVISYKISQHQGNDERSLFTPDEAEFIDGMEDKLKSLRPQSKQEWSEEDKRMLDSITNVLGVMSSANFIPIKREIMIPWLKSLPERFNLQPKQEWKPTEEQVM